MLAAKATEKIKVALSQIRNSDTYNTVVILMYAVGALARDRSEGRRE
jgi:hypothetical protein